MRLWRRSCASELTGDWQLLGQGLQPSEPPALRHPWSWAWEPCPGDGDSAGSRPCAPFPHGQQAVGAPVCTPLSLNKPGNGPSRRGFPDPPMPPGMLRFTLSETHTFKSLPLSGREGTRKEPLNTVLHWFSPRNAAGTQCG